MRMSSTCSTTVVRPSNARSAAIRETAGPHIMPWPHAQAIGDAVDRGAVAPHQRPEQRQVVGRVLDRRRPHLLHAEALRGGKQGVEPALHLPQVGPIDRTTGTGILGGIRHAPEEPALLGPPVDARADVEGHRGGVGVQRGRGLRHDHLMPGVADPGPRLGRLGDGLHRGATGEDHPAGRDRARRRVDAGDDAGGQRDRRACADRGTSRLRGARCRAACIARPYARTFRGGSTQPSVAT